MNNLDLYNIYRPEMKTGDLLTYRTQGVVSTLIHIWSADNHAGLVLAPKEFEGEIHRRWTLEAIGGGARTAYLSYVLEHLHGQAFWHQLKPEYDEFRNAIGCFALEKAGVSKYDFKSLIQMAFGVVSADAAKLICSEYVFLSWRTAGIVQGSNIPNPSELALFGVTLPPVLIVDSGPVEDHPPVQP
jgi:hypothetical protein